MAGGFDSEGMVTYVAQVVPYAPTNTFSNAPTDNPTLLASCWLWGVNIRIPPGHAGVTGLALVDSGQFIIPYDPSNESWIVGNDDDLDFAYNKQIGDNTTFYAYNNSTLYSHEWQVRMIYTPLADYTGGGSIITTPGVPQPAPVGPSGFPIP